MKIPFPSDARLAGACAETGWDRETGTPTPETLANLGLRGLA